MNRSERKAAEEHMDRICALLISLHECKEGITRRDARTALDLDEARFDDMEKGMLKADLVKLDGAVLLITPKGLAFATATRRIHGAKLP